MDELLNTLEDDSYIKTNFMRTEQECELFLKQNNNNTLNLFHMNIRSLEKHFDELLVLISELNSDFDIIVLTETWQGDNDCFNIEGYTKFNQPNKHNKCDGVVVYIKSQYNIDKLSTNIAEANMLDLQITVDNKAVNISCIYRSPSFNPENFISSLDNLLYSKKNMVNHIVVGDININILEDRTSTNCNDYLDTFATYGYNKYLKGSTRNSACLDHIFCKTENQLPITFGILETHITDHFSTLMSMTVINPNNTKYEENLLSKYHSKINYSKLIVSLIQGNWTYIVA